MKNGAAFCPKSKYYNNDFLYKVIPKGIIKLTCFSTYGTNKFPGTFKVILTTKGQVVEHVVKLSIDKISNNYIDHLLNITFDSNITSLEISSISSDIDNRNNVIISYRINYEIS